MVQVAKEDVLKGLKKCKRLAKQALLASNLTDNPSYWNDQAVSRRQTYDLLMQSIEDRGLESTLEMASTDYQDLKHLEFNTDPIKAGRKQALEMFFTIVGRNANSISQMAEQIEDSPSIVG